MIKLLKIEANGLNIFAEDVNIDFYAEQRVFSDNNKMVSNVVNNIYANNVLSVVGVNASGKTTVLRLISLCIDYLNGKSLNNSSYTDIFTDSTEFNINVTFHIESKGIYKLFSEIKLHEDVKIDRRYIFKNEKLYFKKDTLIKTKKDILKFNESNLFRQRDDREEFLQDDISVVSALTKNSKVPVHNLLGSTNLNILRIVGDFPPELLNFLDPSIESIKFDDAGNEASVSRKVFIKKRDAVGTIYLTFDDGPKEGTTNVILDILKEEGVEATFFVTNGGPDELIKREYDEGHTVALHTASHDYATVYASVDAYFNDLNIVSTRVKNITGEESKIIRFPGGSSNTVSRHYCVGIMSTLTQLVLERGYRYYDWNVSSGDAAGGTVTKEMVYSNVVNSLSRDRINVVLMHDIKPYTRDALRDIIRYGKENGYTFERITPATQMVTQRVNN